jgi:hypothetical protein
MKPKDDPAYHFSSITGRLVESSSLSLGQLSSPETVTWIARCILFHFVEKLAQKELRELRDHCRGPFDELRSGEELLGPLRDDLFPHILIATEVEGCHEERIHYLENWDALIQASVYSPAADSLQSSISRWAKQHSLDASWVLEAAWRLLCWWFQPSYTDKNLLWSLPSIFAIGPDGRKHVSGIGFDGNNKYRPELVPAGVCAEMPILLPYDPVAMTQSEYLKRVRGTMKEYCKHQEAGYQKLGLIPAPWMRNKSGSPWVHWEWFVKYQIRRLTTAEIADAHPGTAISENTVFAGVRKVGRYVGLQLRPKIYRPTAATP